MAGDASTQQPPKNTDTNDSQGPKPQPPPPAPGTYFIQIPKEQIYRFPPPENATDPSPPKPNRPARRRFCCCSLAVLLVLLTLVAVLVGVFFLVLRPERPVFSVTGVSVDGIHLSSSSSLISPLIVVKMWSKNANGKLGLIYGGGSTVEISYDGIVLADGEFAEFGQRAGDLTETETALRGSRVELTGSTREYLKEAENEGEVLFDLEIKAPIKFKVGGVTMWTMSVTVNCRVTVDNLTTSATVINENCFTKGINYL